MRTLEKTERDIRILDLEERISESDKGELSRLNPRWQFYDPGSYNLGFDIYLANPERSELEILRGEHPDSMIIIPSSENSLELINEHKLADLIRDDSTLEYYQYILSHATEDFDWKTEAQRDGLTKLYNKKTFDKKLQTWIDVKGGYDPRDHTGANDRRKLQSSSEAAEWEHKRDADRRDTSFTPTSNAVILSFDIDFFKSINDTYGHPEGDRIIRKFADVLDSRAREYDLLARDGGEEFIFAVNGLEYDKAYKLACDIQGEINSGVFDYDGNTRNITASTGVATLRGNEPLKSVRKRVDKATYVSKLTGKDRVAGEFETEYVESVSNGKFDEVTLERVYKDRFENVDSGIYMSLARAVNDFSRSFVQDKENGNVEFSCEEADRIFDIDVSNRYVDNNDGVQTRRIDKIEINVPYMLASRTYNLLLELNSGKITAETLASSFEQMNEKYLKNCQG
ncbi:MAG: GGDEF domain-containing protein [Nanoarchaeota archaeon]|nr:GGDEF domain-containing protein [Nanoarchaeota archaeon]